MPRAQTYSLPPAPAPAAAPPAVPPALPECPCAVPLSLSCPYQELGRKHGVPNFGQSVDRAIQSESQDNSGQQPSQIEIVARPFRGQGACCVEFCGSGSHDDVDVVALMSSLGVFSFIVCPKDVY